MPAPQVAVTVHPAPAAPPAGCADLLAAAFAEPPYRYGPAQIAARLDRWDRYAALPGFRVATARSGPDLVGVAWAWDSVVGRPDPPDLYGDLYERLARQPWGHRLVGVTEVVELAVRPDHRRGGLGGRLLARLVGSGGGWLITPADAPAAAWYERRGWTRAGPVGDRYLVLTSP